MRKHPDNFFESERSILALFKKVVHSGNLHHAYCFIGSHPIRNSLVVEACASCILSADKLPHPDYLTFDCNNDQSIEAVREFISHVQSTPLIAPYRVASILNIHLLSTQAQNALLKTIEEPPKHGIILCTAKHARSILPTIFSRVAVLRLPQPSRHELQHQLEQIAQTSEYEANIPYTNEVPSTREEIVETHQKIQQSIQFFSNVSNSPEQYFQLLQSIFQNEEFNEIPITTVVHWWIVHLLQTAKQTTSPQEKQRSLRLIYALHFFATRKLAINMPLWLQSILAQR